MNQILCSLVLIGLVVIINQSAAFFIPQTDCKTDNTCTGSLTASDGTSTFCCDEGSTITIRQSGTPPVTSCKCQKSFNSFIANLPKRCSRRSCGADGTTGTANGKEVCCRAGYELIITQVQRGSKEVDRCTCEKSATDPAVEAAAPAGAAEPPPAEGPANPPAEPPANPPANPPSNPPAA